MKVLADGEWVTRERVTVIAWLSGAIGVAMLLFMLLTSNDTLDIYGKPVGTDFTAFRTAGLMANEGNSVAAWSPEQLNSRVHEVHPGSDFRTAWLYPPVFLLIASPLASLPYIPALLLWQAFGLIAVGATLWAILRDRRAVLVALACPLTPMVLAHGQNAFLTAALLGSGLLLLERRPVLAGSMLGSLIYKPQLGLLIGPMLLFTRSWRVLCAAAATGAGLVLVSLLLWGADSWKAFFASLSIGRFFMESGAVGFYKGASLFSALRNWDVPISGAHAVQAIGLLGSLALIWRVRSCEPGIRNAGLCAATALSTPYLLDYDLALVGIGAAFIYAEASRTAFHRYERSLLAFIWFAPWVSRAASEYLLIPLATLTTLALLVLVLRRVGSRHRHPAVDVERLPGDVRALPAG